jgi:PAS domain-containing protein
MSSAAEIPWKPQDSEMELHSLFENAPFALAQCQRPGNITALNPALEQMLGGGQGSRDLSASGISFILRAGGGRRAIGKAMILFIISSANGPQCAESLHAAPARKRDGPRPCRRRHPPARKRRRRHRPVSARDRARRERSDARTSGHRVSRLRNFRGHRNGTPRPRGALGSAIAASARKAQPAVRSQNMQSEMREILTAMLLSCELAMSVPDVPHPAVEKIRAIDNLVREPRLRLESN